MQISFARALRLCVFPLVIVAAVAAAAPPEDGYHLIKKVTLGGEGGWDYLKVDSDARRLYISRGTHVMVVDADTYAVVGDIPDTQGVHGIAIASDLGRGFTSNGRSNTVTIFDLKTLKVLGTPATDTGPDAIVYDPASKRVFTFNGRGGSTTAIDGATGNVVGTIKLDGQPEFAVPDGKGHIYNNLEDKSIVVEIDTQALRVTQRWPLAPGESPSGIAMDTEHRRLFSGCHNKMMVVMDADSGKVIATPPIGEGVDANGYDPGTKLAFSSNGRAATLTVVHEDSPDKFSVLQDVPTQLGARTMALDEKTHNVFLVTAEFEPPPAGTQTTERRRPTMKPGSFTLLVVGQ
jgi:DNA-binding beta-propeller fold protein YncE